MSGYRKPTGEYYRPGGGLVGLSNLAGTADGLGDKTTQRNSLGGNNFYTGLYGIATAASSLGLAYHGYRRNDSVGWAIVWALVGGMFWPIGWGVALAQGYGEPKD